MTSDGSVTRWLGPLQDGDPQAAQQLWERYFQRLVGLARQKLQYAPPGPDDEEDVALSAFHSLCRGARAGRFPQLLDRDNLWRLLAVLTARKAAHQVRDAARLKRAGAPAAPGEKAPELDQLLGRELTPAVAAEMADECQRLLSILADEVLQAVALARLEGYGVEEIAAQLGYAPRSIKRKLQMIRSLWEKELGL